MTANISMRVRIIALGGLLAALLVGAATFMMSGSDSDAAEAPVTIPARPKPQNTVTEPAARPPATKPQPGVAAPVVETVAAPVDGIPAGVVKALALHEVVVVSVVSPNAPLDKLAAAEAQAGAKRAGAGFVKVEVTNARDLKRLTADLRVRHTPSLLIFTRPDQVFIQVKGFADRETVAQAAANAS